MVLNEIIVLVVNVSGIDVVVVKGKKKTAWAGTYWTKDGRGKDIEKDVECGEVSCEVLLREHHHS